MQIAPDCSRPPPARHNRPEADPATAPPGSGMQLDPETTVYAHDTALGRWRVALRRVHPALRSVVAQLWLGSGRVAYQRDRILPRAQSYLLINLGPPQYRVLSGPPETRVAFDDIWYSGLSEGPIDTEAPHGSVLLGVAFHTVGAAHLLPWPQHELVNRTGPLADLLGPSASALRERLLQLPDHDVARLRLVEDWLLDRCATGRSVHPLVHWATRRLADSGGTLRASALAKEAGVSRKHLAGLFGAQIGLAPKSLARVHRFHTALDALVAGPRRDQSAIAAACGYYDQSHLIHEFRQYSGMSPAEFVRHAMPDARSVVLR